MIAFKGFTSYLTATRGNGIFKYEIGKTYTENKAQCASTGFHCVEEPIEVLSWYSSETDRYCIVDAMGDIHEDGYERIACSQIRILKEISRMELAVLECKFLQEHPNRTYSKHVKRDSGEAKKDSFVIVRGKHPKAKGKKSSTLFLIKENQKGKEIAEIMVLEVDGKKIKSDTYYRIDGREVK